MLTHSNGFNWDGITPKFNDHSQKNQYIYTHEKYGVSNNNNQKLIYVHVKKWAKKR
jgi:hypothetical protein